MTQRPLASAWEVLPDLARACREGRLALFLDFDGTLAPIVEHPDLARIEPQLADALRHVAARTFVAVISGRDLQDVRRRVGVETLYYAGSHGFEIAGPGGIRHDLGSEGLAELDHLENRLRECLADLEGVWVERKRYAIAVHLRQAAPEVRREAGRRVGELAALNPGLTLRGGKMVLEFRPAVEWHKGHAALWLLTRVADGDRLPVFIGDDVTDEDAFETLAGRGITILVAARPRPTHARYLLRSPAEVAEFLHRLAVDCGGGSSASTRGHR